MARARGVNGELSPGSTDRAAGPAIGRTWLAIAAVTACLAGCGAVSQRTLYAFSAAYSFGNKTIGLAVILEGEEQEALSEGRVARRAIASGENEG